MEESLQNSQILDKSFDVKANAESEIKASETEVTDGCSGVETFEGRIQ